MIDALMKFVVMVWVFSVFSTPSHHVDESELNFVHSFCGFELYLLLPVIDNNIKSFLLLFRLEKTRKTAFNLPRFTLSINYCMLLP